MFRFELTDIGSEYTEKANLALANNEINSALDSFMGSYHWNK